MSSDEGPMTTTTRGPMEAWVEERMGVLLPMYRDAYAREVLREKAREIDARIAQLEARSDEFERGLMRVVVRADTDPTNLTSGMLAQDFRGIAMQALHRGRNGEQTAIAQLEADKTALIEALGALISLTWATDDMRVIARVLGGTKPSAEKYIERADAIDKAIAADRALLARMKGEA